MGMRWLGVPARTALCGLTGMLRRASLLSAFYFPLVERVDEVNAAEYTLGYLIDASMARLDEVKSIRFNMY